MRPDLGFYIQTINKIVQETEEIGDKMNPDYEEVRKLIDEESTNSLTEKRLSDIHSTFKKGTKKYETKLTFISELRPPVKVMGMHKKFERAYAVYVSGCQEMTTSIDPEKGVDVELFNKAEKHQDSATDNIAAALQKMTSLLLK